MQLSSSMKDDEREVSLSEEIQSGEYWKCLSGYLCKSLQYRGLFLSDLPNLLCILQKALTFQKE